MPAIQAVIFDLDDTLLDHRSAATTGAREWLASIGVAPTPDLVDARLIELWFEIERKYFDLSAAGEISVEEHRRKRVQAMLTELGRPTQPYPQLELMFADYLSFYERHWRPFDDVVNAVHQIEQTNTQIAVLTNGTAAMQTRKLRAIGLSQFTDKLFAATATGLSKPNPRAYLNVCETIGSDPARTLHVGDRTDLDYEAPIRAGLQAVQIDRDRPSAKPARTTPSAKPARISSLDQLTNWL